MNGRLNPYPRYKDSGVPWLGDVPEHWSVLPGRACYREKKEPNTGLRETRVLSLSHGQIVVKSVDSMHGLVPASFETYQVVQPNDIIVRPTDLQNDQMSLRFGQSRDRGVITSAYLCLRPLSAVSADYGYLLLHAYDLKKVFYGLGSGLRQNLDWADLKSLACLVPPIDEQRAITCFLDYVGRRVRRYIQAQQRLVELLEEQRHVLILRAVAGKLDARSREPYATYRDVDVPWLREVPEHWSVCRVKDMARIQRGMFTFRPRNDPSLYGGAFPFIQTGDVARASKTIRTYKQTLNERGLAVSKSFPAGTLVMTIAANIGDVAILDFEACFPDSIVSFVPGDGVSRDYLYYVLLIMKAELVRDAPVNTQGNLNIDRVGSQPVAKPPLSEQQEIVAYIERRLLELDMAIDQAKRESDLVREYHVRLVVDVVSGRLDVQQAALNVPEEDPGSDVVNNRAMLAESVAHDAAPGEDSAEEEA